MTGAMNGDAEFDQAALGRAARRYLERFAAAEADVRRVLANRIRRRGGDPGAHEPAIAAVIADLRAAGALDDRLYARLTADSLNRRGVPVRVIRQRLAAKGIAPDDADAALAALAEGHGDGVDRVAAWAYARRRRLGPFRPADQRAERRDRDLAAMGRAGFDWDLAREVIDGDEPA